MDEREINRIYRLFISARVGNPVVTPRSILFALCLLTAVHAAADDTTQPSLTPPPRFRVGGFADFVLRSSATNTARHVLEFDLYGTLRISNSWSALAEGIAEQTWRPPEAGEKPNIDLNLERL